MERSSTAQYLWLDDELLRLKGRKRNIDTAIKQVESQMEGLKTKMIAEYLEDGVVPGDGISVRKVPPSPQVTDELSVPDKYWKVKREIDKTKINNAIKEGVQIPGVAMSNGGYTLAVGKIKERKQA